MKRRLTLGIASTLVLAACSATHTSQNEFSKFGFTDAIYSTRPQTDDPIITILKLENPALLETAEHKDGKLVVDQDLLKAIDTEQASTIEALQKISPEIKVLIRYKRVLNGLVIYSPSQFADKIKALPNVTFTEKSASFSRPKADEEKQVVTIGENTSVKYIGAEAAYAENIHGEGMKVGVIDTGIDYTHKMLAGEGTEAAYKAVNPNEANAGFPNKKVVGGIDLVGTEFDSASQIFTKRMPTPDANPLDEAGHGTHVAGTIAGLGDGTNTYSGVAPEAELYAIKVFGAKGSTSDEIVIAALEYASDPTADFSFSKQLDVVNLSLGSGYGNPHLMYAHAIRNLTRGGTLVVASAGNSGDKSYIVGSPGTTAEAISVASSIDNMLQNIEFPMAVFNLGDSVLKAEMVEAAITKTLASFTEMKGEVIYAGLGGADFDETQAAQIKGKVALMDRGGQINFADKIKRAQAAGAIAVIVANNSDEDPISMGGGKEKYDIPAVMVAKKIGTAVKEKLKTGTVQVDLKPNEKIQKPEMADTISPFSSRGPRSEDGLIKPEIASPGSNIISADIGGGDKGVMMSGTSMAAPHIAGVMALLKQKHKDATPEELKSILMGQAKLIADKTAKVYTVSRQGAGRVQIKESLVAKLVTSPAALSFGITDVETQKTLAQELTVKNISQEALTLKADHIGVANLQFNPTSVTLAPGESKKIQVSLKVTASTMKNQTEELDGYVTFGTEKDVLVKVPALVVARKISQVSAKSLKVQSSSAADGAGSVAELELQNQGVQVGTAYAFNLLGKDGRKQEARVDYAHNRNCDMQSAGYRIIEKDGARVLQVAVKLYERMTTWNTCEVNVQIDADGDGQADQEIAGVPQESLPGLTGESFVSLLLDGNKARALRKQFEVDLANPPKDKDGKVQDVKENYTSAVLAISKMQVFDGATLAIIEADVSKLTLASTGELQVKVSTTHSDSGVVEMDDYLNKEDQQWDKISVNPMGQSFKDLPEKVELKGQEKTTLQIQKGYGTGDLIVYVPENRGVSDSVLEDAQSQVVTATFGN